MVAGRASVFGGIPTWGFVGPSQGAAGWRGLEDLRMELDGGRGDRRGQGRGERLDGRVGRRGEHLQERTTEMTGRAFGTAVAGTGGLLRPAPRAVSDSNRPVAELSQPAELVRPSPSNARSNFAYGAGMVSGLWFRSNRGGPWERPPSSASD